MNLSWCGFRKRNHSTSSSKDHDTLSRAMAYQRSYDKFSTSGALSCDIFNAVFLTESDQKPKTSPQIVDRRRLACAEPCASARPMHCAAPSQKRSHPKKNPSPRDLPSRAVPQIKRHIAFHNLGCAQGALACGTFGATGSPRNPGLNCTKELNYLQLTVHGARRMHAFSLGFTA
jgi:hypothetical protein